ncbi:hypothetical protein FE257_004056 [Aspergillus nanangensis]|uniref:Zn(2)-C6 fungal-type domain-containing protein n=1 Tax=Aspergillus nanangensis TaxID=2582783 RepID=A0AAD4GN99_ASPNN|nr:hypothetical protein FE257_004056 [Aspergillus nanangensis]
MSSVHEIPDMKATTLTIMATRGEDQGLVLQTAKSLSDDCGRLSSKNEITARVLPCFGWHPWFSHQIQDDTSAPSEPGAEHKQAHYKKVLTPSPDETFISELPDPKLLSQLISETRARLQSHPRALVGEVGLDRAFRLPQTWTQTQIEGRDGSITPGSREGRHLSPYRVQLDHQKAILKAQLCLAGELRRAVSVHSVQAHGAVFDLFKSMWSGHERKVPSRRERRRRHSATDAHTESDAEDAKQQATEKIEPPLPFPPRICMHSYSGSVEQLKQFLNPANPSDVYFSFSSLINFSGPSAQKVKEVIKALPDNRVLIESDLHTAGQQMDDLLEEIARQICELRAHNSQTPTGNGVTKRKSGTAACVHCHRRKVRCDARLVGLPCSNCRSTGKTDCRIHEKKKRLSVRSILDPVPILCRPPTASDPTSKPIPATPIAPPPPSAFTTAFRGIQPDVTTPASNGTPKTHSPHTTFTNSNGTHNHDSQSTPDSQRYDRQSGPGSVEHDANKDLEKRLVKLIDEEDSGSREIQRGVRAIYVGHELSNMSFLIRQQRDKDDGVYHFAGNEIPRRQLRTGHDQLLVDALTLPEPALADELLQAYFTHVNPGYPIVEEDLFMAQYRSRDPADPPPILLLQAILLVGTHVIRPKAERDTLKEIFYRRTKWLFDNRIERNRDIMVQAALLLSWHSDSADDDVAANAPYWIGLAARIATGLGMHRNPVQSRPQAINLEDSDVSPLTHSDFEGCGSRVQFEYVIHFSELCTMISFIVRERFGLRVSPERRKAVLQEADESLANWSFKLPDNLRLRASDMDPWSAMLHLTYNNFLILLHRPHPRASAYSDDYGPHDAEICSAAAGVIASIFEELRLNDRLKYLWYSGVHTLFTAMIQVRVELRFSNPVLAINALRRFDSTSYSLRELAEYWSHASTILRLFEDSKRLQEDLRLATSERPRRFSGNAHDQGKTMIASTSRDLSDTEHPMQSSQMSRLPFEVPTPESPHLSQGEASVSPHQHQPFDNWIPPSNWASVDPIDQPREFLDWRQLFSFTDAEQPVPMAIEGLPELEDEWRQIYWQEAPLGDLLQEGGWMHG